MCGRALAEPHSCKRWLQGKFGGKAPEGMQFWQFVLQTWHNLTEPQIHWHFSTGMAKGGQKNGWELCGFAVEIVKLKTNFDKCSFCLSTKSCACFANALLLRLPIWGAVNPSEQKEAEDLGWAVDVGSGCPQWSFQSEYKHSIVALRGSSRIATVALHFLISTSQFCKVWHSASMLFSLYRFVVDVHLSFGFSWLHV